ncbi:MAG: phosphodiesterase [Hyphomicrobiales bacterium]|nr:phosphodiesterase [Hyphomicrobiales bacterium]
MLIAQITDLHLRPRGKAAYRVSETNMLAERAFAALAALRPAPDVVLITGDLTDCGLPEEYEILRGLVKRLPMPVFAVPGNHDRRDAMHKALPEMAPMHARDEFIQFVVDDFPIRLIGLDTVTPGKSSGALCSRRLRFLEEALASEPQRRTLIFMHHPPFITGVDHMDHIRLLDGADGFSEILARNPQVRLVVCGHVHRKIVTRVGHAICSIAPSVGHQVAFDFLNGAEGGLVFEPPAFDLHWLPDAGELVSHTVYVERYPGPFPFALDPDYPGGH